MNFFMNVPIAGIDREKINSGNVYVQSGNPEKQDKPVTSPCCAPLFRKQVTSRIKIPGTKTGKQREFAGFNSIFNP